MIFALTALSAFTGAAKSISVCGVNSAMTVSAAHRGTVTVAYLLALLLGSITLVLALLGLGHALAAVIPVDFGVRRTAAAGILFVLAIVELVRGPNALPHIAWAVPRTVAEHGLLGSVLFGWIRGIAVLNHSPFLSMHGWVAVLILMPELVSPAIMALAFGIGLALWTIVEIGQRLRRHSSFQLDIAGAAGLVRSRLVARADAFALVLCAALIMVAL